MYDTIYGGGNHRSDTSTTWSNQPGTGDWLDHDAHGYGGNNSACPAPHDVFLQAKQAAQAETGGVGAWMTLRLSATSDDESNLS